jgi:hypothetical protein
MGVDMDMDMDMGWAWRFRGAIIQSGRHFNLNRLLILSLVVRRVLFYGKFVCTVLYCTVPYIQYRQNLLPYATVLNISFALVRHKCCY